MAIAIGDTINPADILNQDSSGTDQHPLMGKTVDPADIVSDTPTNESADTSSEDNSGVLGTLKKGYDFANNARDSVVEPAFHMASAIVAKPASDVAGLVAVMHDYITGNTDGDPGGFKDYAQNFLTYEPKTEAGKWGETQLEKPLAPVGRAINYVTGKAGQGIGAATEAVTGSPAAGDIARAGGTEAADQALNFIGPGEALKLASKVADPVLNSIGDMASKAAANRAFAAMGGNKTVLNGLSGVDKIKSAKEAGRFALDNDVIPMSGNVDTMMERNDALRTQGGANQMEAVKSAVDNFPKDTGGKILADPGLLADIIEDKYDPILSGKEFSTPAMRTPVKQVLNFLRNYPDNTMTVADLQNFKTRLMEGKNWGSDQPGAKVLQDVWHTVDDHVDAQIKNYANKSGDSGALDQWNQAKNVYKNTSNIDLALTDKEQRDQAKKVASFGNLMAGLIGGATHGPLGVLGGVAIKEGLQKYTNPNAALALNNISKGAKAAQGVGNMGPTARMGTNAVVNSAGQQANKDEINAKTEQIKQLLQRSPNSLGKYAKSLADAASRGDDKLAATMYMLGTSDPDYRDMMDNLSSDNEE